LSTSPSSPTQDPSPPGPITRGMLKKIQEDGDSQNPLKPKAIHLLFKWAKEILRFR